MCCGPTRPRATAPTAATRCSTVTAPSTAARAAPAPRRASRISPPRASSSRAIASCTKAISAAASPAASKPRPGSVRTPPSCRPSKAPPSPPATTPSSSTRRTRSGAASRLSDMTKALFEDLLVLDCASFVAGPAATTIMSDFGARVIKIEPPGAGDSYRQLIHLPGTPVSDRDYYWMLDNRNKESLALDLKQDAAQDILRTLVKKADVFVTNFPGPIRDRLKLRPDDILSLNERIIYASLTPYGEEGPEKDRTGYDSTAWWARSGLMHAVRATAQSEPARSIPAMGDHPTAVSLYAAIMTGLYRRSITGKGGMVSTSLLANGLWSNGCYMQAALVGAKFQPRAPRYRRSALLEVYRCK